MATVIPNGTLSPARLMTSLREVLAGWADGAGLKLLEAGDPFAVYDLLSQHPDGGCVVTLWEGDAPQAQAGRSLVVRHTVSVSITKPMNPRRAAAHLSDAATTGAAPLLALVCDARSRVLSLRVDGVAAEFTYGGCQPLMHPSGVPLDGYRLTFTLRAAVPVEDARGSPAL